MDPTTFALVVQLMELGLKAMVEYPKIRELLDTTQKDQLDLLYKQAMADSNATADELRATPEDPA